MPFNITTEIQETNMGFLNSSSIPASIKKTKTVACFGIRPDDLKLNKQQPQEFEGK